MSTEALTPDERAILEGCYRCVCSGCARRRELIAKALRIIDQRAPLVRDIRDTDPSWQDPEPLV